MNNLFTYLFELNMYLVILYAGYKFFFIRDRNFKVRRIYLQGVIAIPLLLLLIPEAARVSVGQLTPASIKLEEFNVFASGSKVVESGGISTSEIITFFYLLIFILGLLKLIIQLGIIVIAIIRSERIDYQGTTFLVNSRLHASSFFGIIFIDPSLIKRDAFIHILEHENIHKRELHSIDRILTELFVLVNWFNPIAWMLRNSVIDNLEYLADSAVLYNGTDSTKYQWTIMNQYIGSVSITNQFSSQIKKRITMLNKDFRLGRGWKLILLLPLAFLAFYLVSCAQKENIKEVMADEQVQEVDNDELSSIREYSSILEVDPDARSEVFYIVEEMPKFNGGFLEDEFRKYIAKNIRYPKEAAENGVSGRMIIKFVVTSNGKVVIRNVEELASVSDQDLKEVVVTSFGQVDNEIEEPNEKYIELLKQEVTRLISESVDWTPGKQRGKNVNVLITFPVNFVLQ